MVPTTGADRRRHARHDGPVKAPFQLNALAQMFHVKHARTPQQTMN